jgi:hypothetical protein
MIFFFIYILAITLIFICMQALYILDDESGVNIIRYFPYVFIASYVEC